MNPLPACCADSKPCTRFGIDYDIPYGQLDEAAIVAMTTLRRAKRARDAMERLCG